MHKSSLPPSVSLVEFNHEGHRVTLALHTVERLGPGGKPDGVTGRIWIAETDADLLHFIPFRGEEDPTPIVAHVKEWINDGMPGYPEDNDE